MQFKNVFYVILIECVSRTHPGEYAFSLTFIPSKNIITSVRIIPDRRGCREAGERDHKPGSVLDDHLSRPYVTARLKRLRRTRRAAGLPPLHLAPGGVYSGNRLPGFRVSSYLAFPSLPPEGGGFFLLHSPWSRLRRPLAGTLALRCPDFPHTLRHAIVCSPRTRAILPRTGALCQSVPVWNSRKIC